MHKKTLEGGSSPATGKCDPSQQQASSQRAEDAEAEEKRSETKSTISKEELRENSIAALRAKAQEHSAKVLGTISQDRPLEGEHERHTAEESDPQESPEEEASSP